MRLNLACGANIFPGWINMDVEDMEDHYLRHLRGCDNFTGWPEEQRLLAEALKRGEVEFIQHDVLEGLPFEDGTVDAIYLGQMIEHLNPIHEAPKFLRECHRVLKKGGAVRITTPDLKRLLELYEKDELDELVPEQPAFYRGAGRDAQLSYILYGAAGQGCTRYNYEGHFMCYSMESLLRLAISGGFGERFGNGMSDVFRGTIDKGMSHSLVMEIFK